MPQLRHAPAAFLALASIALLPGCTAQHERFTDLQGDRESRDELPQLADYAYGNVDVSTSRFVGEHEGTSLWLAQGNEDSTVCLVAVAAEDEWVTGCGGLTVKIGGAAGTYEVVADGATAPEGAVRISENVYAW